MYLENKEGKLGILILKHFACHMFCSLSVFHIRRPFRFPEKRISKLSDAKLNVPFNGGLRLLPNIMKEYDSVATNLKSMENMEDLENSGEFEKLSKLGKTQGK